MKLHEKFHHPARPNITSRDIAEFLIEWSTKVNQDLIDLQAAVAAEDTVIGSAVTLINGIAQRIADAGTDPVALQALKADVQAQAAALGAAVTANTPADNSAGGVIGS